MKKILTRIALAMLLVAMVLTVVACGGDKNENPTEAPTTPVETPTEAPTNGGEEVTTGGEEVTTGGNEEVTYDEDYVDNIIDDVVQDPF